MVKIKFDFISQRKKLNIMFIRLFYFILLQKKCNLYLGKKVILVKSKHFILK
jgi:hypothetical protein